MFAETFLFAVLTHPLQVAAAALALFHAVRTGWAELQASPGLRKPATQVGHAISAIDE